MRNHQNNVEFLLCRLAEDDVLENRDIGGEYSKFDKLLEIIPRNSISEDGIAYDIDNNSECGHIIKFIKDVAKEKNPKLDMTCGSFFSRNSNLQSNVSRLIKKLSQDSIPVSVFAGGDNVRDFLDASISFNTYNRHSTHVPHFMVTNERFLLEMPHTEKSQIRVDIISDSYEQKTRKDILDFLKNIITELKNKV